VQLTATRQANVAGPCQPPPLSFPIGLHPGYEARRTAFDHRFHLL